MMFCEHGDYSEGHCPECAAILELLEEADEVDMITNNPNILDMLERKAQEPKRDDWKE